ncbi:MULTISPECIES: stringent starvation protein SspA [Gallibacterium]|jgi:RNA polymerase-associated protein|uniref:Stringent starvation protein A n=6 Tax=Gallibacterium TaxID=155493 RepID=A0A0A2XVX0_9PAST|nr:MULTISPECIES: stringent starvation protein SspA [Gallibacterium]AEC17040.1 stringent starvation protein A [Gallibacterium anatis UMN179]ERF79118.1 starvation protein A [Gallibacterium anatis 12656/12]KGQ26874.1 stringent starvation protein A [Gallibacterium anatis CCM5995]KGQ28772.1 stringent starvation protein A [Gallibacterium anatis]KGQ28998.1 stringent starvation protein A [Gallibacterium anatis]
MTIAANRRSIMTLFADKNDIYCHQVKIVLAEKGVAYETENIEPGEISEDLLELNPTGSLPTLVDRDLVLFNSRIIMEYLDERFPHPPLMPVYPVARAECRLLMQRIENDWYPVFAKAVDENNPDSIAARKQLREELLAVAPIFTQYEYFMSNEFSLVDCYLAPLLWRIQLLGIEFSGAGSKAIKNYMNKVFSRDSFAKSLGNSSALNIMDDK